MSQAKNDLPPLQLLNKRGVYSDLDQVKLIEDQLQKRFGTSASLQLGYFGTRYGIPKLKK